MNLLLYLFVMLIKYQIKIYINIKNDYDVLDNGAHIEMTFFIMGLNGRLIIIGVIHLL